MEGGLKVCAATTGWVRVTEVVETRGGGVGWILHLVSANLAAKKMFHAFFFIDTFHAIFAFAVFPLASYSLFVQKKLLKLLGTLEWVWNSTYF